MHPLLIPISLYTHAGDSLSYEINNNRTKMTYLDLLTELQNLPEKELIKDVQLYDLDCEEYLPAFSFRYHKQTPTIEI